MNAIYHLAPAARWRDWPAGAGYLPAEYDADGFIHCTRGEELMLQVANSFYRAQPGDFVLLVIEADLLAAPVRWERSADHLAAEFPHIYGPINRAAVVAERLMLRDTSGDFIGIVAG